MNIHKNAPWSPRGRAAAVHRVLEQRHPATVVAATFGVSERTMRKWLARFRAEGAARLQDRSSRPHRLPRGHGRRRRYADRAAALPAVAGPPDCGPARVPRATVSRILRRLGLGRVGHRITGDRRSRVVGIGWEYAYVCVDDASRLAYVDVLPEERQGCARGLLRRAVRWLGRHVIRVERVMTA